MRTDELKANARLIAAAPDLLAALEAFVSSHDDYTASMGNLEFDDPLTDALALARGAVAAAKGTQP